MLTFDPEILRKKFADKSEILSDDDNSESLRFSVSPSRYSNYPGSTKASTALSIKQRAFSRFEQASEYCCHINNEELINKTQVHSNIFISYVNSPSS